MDANVMGHAVKEVKTPTRQTPRKDPPSLRYTPVVLQRPASATIATTPQITGITSVSMGATPQKTAATSIAVGVSSQKTGAASVGVGVSPQNTGAASACVGVSPQNAGAASVGVGVSPQKVVAAAVGVGVSPQNAGPASQPSMASPSVTPEGMMEQEGPGRGLPLITLPLRSGQVITPGMQLTQPAPTASKMFQAAPGSVPPGGSDLRHRIPPGIQDQAERQSPENLANLPQAVAVPPSGLAMPGYPPPSLGTSSPYGSPNPATREAALRGISPVDQMRAGVMRGLQTSQMSPNQGPIGMATQPPRTVYGQVYPPLQTSPSPSPRAASFMSQMMMQPPAGLHDYPPTTTATNNPAIHTILNRPHNTSPPSIFSQLNMPNSYTRSTDNNPSVFLPLGNSNSLPHGSSGNLPTGGTGNLTLDGSGHLQPGGSMNIPLGGPGNVPPGGSGSMPLGGSSHQLVGSPQHFLPPRNNTSPNFFPLSDIHNLDNSMTDYTKVRTLHNILYCISMLKGPLSLKRPFPILTKCGCKHPLSIVVPTPKLLIANT